MPNQYEMEKFRAALSQGDWRVEMPSSRVLKITDFLVEGSTLFLTLEDKEVVWAEKIEMEVKKVFIDGTFGTGNPEPRRFEVSGNLPAVFSYFSRSLDGKGRGLVFVRDQNAPPGWPLERSYDSYRTPTAAQPRALKVGDVLVTGRTVMSASRQGRDKMTLVHIREGTPSGRWVSVDSEIPIAICAR